ncbi:hypothetical protein ACIFUY_29400 [Streptomyces sp. CACIS-1.16CA]
MTSARTPLGTSGLQVFPWGLPPNCRLPGDVWHALLTEASA